MCTDVGRGGSLINIRKQIRVNKYLLYPLFIRGRFRDQGTALKLMHWTVTSLTRGWLSHACRTNHF